MKALAIAPVVVSALLLAPLAHADRPAEKYGRSHSFTATAKVIDSQPIYKTVTVNEPRQQCTYEEVAYYDDDPGYSDFRDRGHGGNSALGMIVGGVVGGAVGNQFGHSTNSKIAGAVIGSAIGHDVASKKQVAHREHRRDYPRYREERRCHTINERHTEERLTGYRVTYRYQGHTFTRRMDRDPGQRIRVRINVSPDLR